MTSVEVWAWGEKAGIVIQEGNTVAFELTGDKHRRISPLLFQNTGVARCNANMIHEIGPIADALPGSYGMDFLGQYFIDEFGRKPSITESLSFVGSHGLGALEFRPESSATGINGEMFATLEALKTRSRNVYEGEHDFDLAKLIAVSNSAAGGARTKAVVGFNPDIRQIHIAQKHDSEPEGYRKCIIKYNPKTGTAKETYNDEIKAEYLYALLAKEAGIHMSDVWLFEDNGANYFVTERFDVTPNGERLHMHSYAGLIGSDASTFSSSYDGLFRTGVMLGVPPRDKAQMFRVMVFNLVFANRDDHARNFTFLMDKNGMWNFAPAYDLTFSEHNYGANHHQLKINGAMASAAGSLAINKVARLCGIKKPLEIFEEMIEIKHEKLRQKANELGVSQELVAAVLNATGEIDKKFSKR